MVRNLMFRLSSLLFASLLLTHTLIAQNSRVSFTDTTSLLHAFKAGKFGGHFRYFFMATDNEKGLTDYYANAVGGGLRFETANFHHFQFAISGFYIFNIGSSNLVRPDSASGQVNRYEIQLFDITDPANKKNLDRLEELYLKYNFKTSNVRIGRQLINTAFINLQDGRMRPTVTEGIWVEMNEVKRSRIQLGWIWGLSPRSTTNWYRPGESIGIYPVGVNPDGTRSGYSHNIRSGGIAIFELESAITKNLHLQLSNMFVENIFNTTLLQIGYTFPLKNRDSIEIAVQSIKQFAVNNGGNEDPSKTYFVKGTKPFSFGIRAGWKNDSWGITVNYNRITRNGRYLNPREWGIDPFFTFLQRERNDGLGDVHAIMGKLSHIIRKARLKTSLAAGYYRLPDVKNYPLNKYGLPSYLQVNGDIKYTFANTFKGLEATLLLVGKKDIGETYNNKKYVFNKVEMLQYNVILNYHF